MRGGSPTNRRDGGQVGAEAEARIQPEAFPCNRRTFGRRPGCVRTGTDTGGGSGGRPSASRGGASEETSLPALDLGLLASGTRRGWLSSHQPASANWQMQVLGAQCLLKAEAIKGSRPCPGLAPRVQGGRGVSGRLRLGPERPQERAVSEKLPAGGSSSSSGLERRGGPCVSVSCL